MDFPTPAIVTEVAPTEPVITYDPYATIVYNAHPQPYYDVTPKTVTASDITSTFRNDKSRAEKIVKMNTQIDNVRDYLIENHSELGEHATEIAELLEIDLSATLEVEFTVTITATILAPIGTTVDDLSYYDFDVELSSNDNDYEIESCNADIERIS